MFSEVIGKREMEKQEIDKDVKISPFDRITKDLIADILSRLPVKPLMRVKCVSKSWCSFIEDPTFINFYQSKGGPIVVVPSDRGRDADKRLSYYSINRSGIATYMFTSIYGDRDCKLRYCNGLICYLNVHNILAVCNPSMEENITLPRPDRVNQIYDFEIGFDPSTEKYKVLIWSSSPGACYEVFTLGTSSWRPLGNRPTPSLGSEHLCVDGTFYCCSLTDRLITFNLANEKFDVIPYPNRFSAGSCSYLLELKESLLESGGCLCLINLDRGKASDMMDIWMLKDNVWILMIKRISMPLQCRNHAPFSVGNGAILLGLAYEGDHYIYLYSFLNNQFNRMKVVGIPMKYFSARNYAESSVSLRNL